MLTMNFNDVMMDFVVWLTNGGNCGEKITSQSAAAYVSRISAFRRKYMHAERYFLEDVFGRVSNFNDWVVENREFIRGTAKSDQDYEAIVSNLRAFWRYLKYIRNR